MERVETTKANGSKGPRGRIDKDHQEQVLKDPVLREKVQQLVKTKKKLDDDAESYSDDVKAAAEKSGYHASTIRSVVAALASEDFDDKARKVAQLALAFEAVAK